MKTTKKDDFELALNLLIHFVDFVKVPDIRKAIDGAFDPDASVEMAKNLLDRRRPGWDKEELALPA